MRTREMHILVFWFVMGWLFAAVAANRLFAAGLIDSGSLCQGLVKELSRQHAMRLFRILVIRLTEFGLLSVGCRGRAGMAVARVAAVLQGVSTAFALVLFTWGFGWYGLPRFLAASLPHELFYLALVVWILVCVAFRWPIRARRFLIVGMFLFVSGILSEILL